MKAFALILVIYGTPVEAGRGLTYAECVHALILYAEIRVGGWCEPRGVFNHKRRDLNVSASPYG